MTHQLRELQSAMSGLHELAITIPPAIHGNGANHSNRANHNEGANHTNHTNHNLSMAIPRANHNGAHNGSEESSPRIEDVTEERTRVAERPVAEGRPVAEARTVATTTVVAAAAAAEGHIRPVRDQTIHQLRAEVKDDSHKKILTRTHAFLQIMCHTLFP